MNEQRWNKSTEILKQNQYSPLKVAEQVIAVFSGVRGFLDDVDLNKIKSFEAGLIEKIKSEKPELIEKIQSTGKLEEDTENALMQTIEEYKKSL